MKNTLAYRQETYKRPGNGITFDPIAGHACWRSIPSLFQKGIQAMSDTQQTQAEACAKAVVAMPEEFDAQGVDV